MEECQRFAKQYINAIKVRLPGHLLPLWGPGDPEKTCWETGLGP